MQAYTYTVCLFSREHLANLACCLHKNIIDMTPIATNLAMQIWLLILM